MRAAAHVGACKEELAGSVGNGADVGVGRARLGSGTTGRRSPSVAGELRELPPADGGEEALRCAGAIAATKRERIRLIT